MTQELEKIAPGQDIEMPPLPPEPEQEVEHAEEEPEAEAQPKESAQERNFREMRKAKEAAEKERDDMRRMIEELKNAQSQKEDAVAQYNQEEDDNLRPEDIPEWRHVQKHIKKLESKLAEYESQSKLQSTESQLKAKYPDFDQVVSADNINKLREKYPELATNLASNSDLYSKGVSAYTMIKRLGIAEDQVYEGDRNRAQANANKPRPLASVAPQQGDSPLSRANAFAEGLTDELAEQLRKKCAML